MDVGLSPVLPPDTRPNKRGHYIDHNTDSSQKSSSEEDSSSSMTHPVQQSTSLLHVNPSELGRYHHSSLVPHIVKPVNDVQAFCITDPNPCYML